MYPSRSLSHGPSSVSSDDFNGAGSPSSKNSSLPSNFDAQQVKADLASTMPVLRGPSDTDEDNVVMRTGSQQVHFYRRSIKDTASKG